MSDIRLVPPERDPSSLTIRLELYVAGDTLNSRRAIINLQELLRTTGREVPFRVIDVLKEPHAAFQRGIFGTPSLVAQVGDRQTLILGDLSDPEPVLRSLELPTTE